MTTFRILDCVSRLFLKTCKLYLFVSIIVYRYKFLKLPFNNYIIPEIGVFFVFCTTYKEEMQTILNF